MLFNNDPNNTIMFNKNCTQLPFPQVSQSVFGRLGDSLGGSWERFWGSLGWESTQNRTLDLEKCISQFGQKPFYNQTNAF